MASSPEPTESECTELSIKNCISTSHSAPIPSPEDCKNHGLTAPQLFLSLSTLREAQSPKPEALLISLDCTAIDTSPNATI